MHHGTFVRLLLLSFTLFSSVSCDSLFGGLAKGNPESCVVTPSICNPDTEVCNTATRDCEPALRVESITPSAAPFDTEVNVTVTGKNFVPNMQLFVDGQPATSLVLQSDTQLNSLFPASSRTKASVPIELVTPTTQRLRVDGMFHYFPWPQFAQPVNQPFDGYQKFIRSGDFNGDGRPDLAVASDFTSGIGIFLTQADGNLIQAPSAVFSSRPFFVAVGDLNGDGKVDLAVAQTGPQPQVEYAIGKGDGTFTVAGKVNTSLTVGTLALVDVNHDRKADLIIPDGSFLNTFLSNGDGTFGSAIPLVHSFQPIDSNCALAVGDVNGDGEVDILLTTPRDARTGVFLGRGNGTFVELAAVSNGSILEQPVLADLNGDKKLDLALVDRSHSQVVVFQGDGKGGFSQVSVNPGTKYPDSIGVADVNGV